MIPPTMEEQFEETLPKHVSETVARPGEDQNWKGWIEKPGGLKVAVTGRFLGHEKDRAWVFPVKLELKLATDANE